MITPYFMYRTPRKICKIEKLSTIKIQYLCQLSCKFNVKMLSIYLKLWAPEHIFVNLLRCPGINSQPGGPVWQPYFWYWPARLHRMAELIPRNWFLGSLNVYKYGLWSQWDIKLPMYHWFWKFGGLFFVFGQFLRIFWGSLYFFNPSKYPLKWPIK
jgi:hypothetical protein